MKYIQKNSHAIFGTQVKYYIKLMKNRQHIEIKNIPRTQGLEFFL